MNPAIETGAGEAARWLEAFARSHAKRRDARLEVVVETRGPAGAGAVTVRLVLGTPGAGLASSPIELTLPEVREGRSRFAWCQALAGRIQGAAAELATGPGASGPTAGSRAGG